MIIKLDWELFKLKYFLENNIFVKEFEDKWVMLTQEGTIKIVCEKMKSKNDEENIIFVDKYLSDKYLSDKNNIIKVMNIEGFENKETEETEETNEEFVKKLE